MDDDETTDDLGLGAVLGTGSGTQMKASMAPLLDAAQLLDLVRELAARDEQHEALEVRQRAAIAKLEVTVADQAWQLEQQRVVVQRLEAELRARRLSRGEVPRNVGDFMGWRERRQLTQAQAAEVLGLGRATVERAEAQDLDTELGRALQRAIIRYTDAMNAADTPPPASAKKAKKRSALLG